MKLPYTSYKNFMIAQHGVPLHRVPIDFNFGCPNREADGSGGCTFCNVRGSAAVQTRGADTVEEQMQAAIAFARRRYGAKKFMAYIQAFSATFGEAQQPLYLNLLDAFDFSAVSIGTRPDCITPQALDFLSELNEHIEVWVELGVQTIHDRTLERIHRGHDWASSERAIEQLHARGIPIALHAILGLPGEDQADFQATANRFAQLPIQAVKIHNLHVEKGTTLALEHALQPLPLFMEYDFAEVLIDFIRRMPPDLPIMRLTTDTPEAELIAPRWQMDKMQFKQYVIERMNCMEWQQGDLYASTEKTPPLTHELLSEHQTEDGSLTFYHAGYKEHFHTRAGARLEASGKYTQPAHLSTRLAHADVTLLDICFGLGYNSLMAAESALEAAHTLRIDALEMDRRIVGLTAEKMESHPDDQLDWNQVLHALYKEGISHPDPHVAIQMHWGDARHRIQSLPDGHYDLIFLDAFSSSRNSELWSVEFFTQIKRILNPSGSLFTYAAAGPIRSGLIQAGFYVGETKPVGRPRGGTQASLDAAQIETPISPSEMEILQTTTRGIPFRDPHHVWTHRQIIRDRENRVLAHKK